MSEHSAANTVRRTPKQDGKRVHLRMEGWVAEILIDNPPLNLVTSQVLTELADATSELRRHKEVRVLILSGEGGRAFSAGSDMREFEDLRVNPELRKIIPEHLLWRDIARLPIPTIAAIEGHALGGGFELALCCDLRVASEQSKVGLPEAAIGGLATVATQRLPRLVGVARAKQLILLGDLLTASDALQMGLLTKVVPPGQARAVAREMADALAAKGPVSLRLAKELIDSAFDSDIDAGLTCGVDATVELFQTRDLLEGARSFFEKRPPNFIGE